MGEPKGFLRHRRELSPERPAQLRVLDWREVHAPFGEETARIQASRCMDCGVPFCHQGCPLGNLIPDWNDLAFRGRWPDALRRLEATNNFPEITGLVCPAPCETACVLGINDSAVTIKQTEFEIARRVLDAGGHVPRKPHVRTGQRVAVVGSGPTGLAAAQQLNRSGHTVMVFEKDESPGGLLRLGIPDFKLEKWLIDRRIAQMLEEGVEFRTGGRVGADIPADSLVADYDAVLLAGGAGKPRDLPVEGRNLAGVHFALEFLTRQNRRVAGAIAADDLSLHAKDKHVVVIGGGDTGSDCVGTALRQGARTVRSLEILERPPEGRPPATPWPTWPMIFRSSSSHDEGGTREFAVMTTRLSGSHGKVGKLHAVRVKAGAADASGARRPVAIAGSDFDVPADLVLLALGFVHPVHEGLLEQLQTAFDPRGNVLADPRDFATNIPKVFAAGDLRRGQSLVVWAIREGREAAASICRFLRRPR